MDERYYVTVCQVINRDMDSCIIGEPEVYYHGDDWCGASSCWRGLCEREQALVSVWQVKDGILTHIVSVLDGRDYEHDYKAGGFYATHGMGYYVRKAVMVVHYRDTDTRENVKYHSEHDNEKQREHHGVETAYATE